MVQQGRDDDLEPALDQVQSLTQFAHDAITAALDADEREGSDLPSLLSKAGISAPASIQLSDVAWDDPNGPSDGLGDRQMVMMLPGHPEALGFTVGCIRIRGRRYCLECGWIWCRIVIRW